ncbi:YjhX family toxin [Aliamphritea spongicola]|uniref:YjhX family toxin n=1 Tax=Aliamphritea spongicola TaxID=707589 RepID=UPI00196A7EEC|nr:YjhX family toxin [Aliamphritea spongicola]
MNISKQEQRVLHILALGGSIRYLRKESGKVHEITCYTREGNILSNCTIDTFHRLKRKKLINSKKSQPYRITKLGALSVQSQMMQR